MDHFEFKDKETLVDFSKENVLTRREAEEYLNISRQSFTRSLKKGKFAYFKAVGEGKGQSQLYLKQDLEAYRKELLTDLKKYNPQTKRAKGEDKP